MNIEILCCDIDGTLVRDDKSLSEENKYWIRRLVKEKGVKFVLVSGRLLAAMKGFNEAIGIKEAVSCYNGCSFYNEDYKLIYEHRLSTEIANKILAVSRKVGMELVFFDDTDWIIEDMNSFVYEQKLPLYMCPPVICPFEKFLEKKQTNKIIALDKDSKKIKNFKEELRKVGIDEKNTTLYLTNTFFEVMPKGYSKGTAIEDLSKYYKVDKSKIMAIGDDYNDIEMLKMAGLSIGMGNSVPEVKEIVDWITDTNMNDGVAKAIQKYFF